MANFFKIELWWKMLRKMGLTWDARLTLRDKMDAIYHTTFSSTFSWTESIVFWIEIHRNMFLEAHLTRSLNWFRQCFGTEQVTKHHLKQWLPRFLPPIYVTQYDSRNCMLMPIWQEVWIGLDNVLAPNSDQTSFETMIAPFPAAHIRHCIWLKKLYVDTRTQLRPNSMGRYRFGHWDHTMKSPEAEMLPWDYPEM